MSAENPGLEKDDPLSRAAKNMDERLRVANLGAAVVSHGAPDAPVGHQITPSSPRENSGIKAFLALLSIPVVVSLFAGLAPRR